ncbi:cupredoxin domain-containing protein [Ramlibacter alkalitolerans]|uniref:Nitrous-oxide reductase n=1 Tax=Ramlibacter alkalitolerans TaxID=2039631 RepID=A0ABS1JP58_9BURK|nr:cupredoxin domain-containing protein [Ramlibacter alkalitolerans]MBL0425310.1 cupredoxin domain-containing protein [Ramlibacter alkalitolerans]
MDAPLQRRAFLGSAAAVVLAGGACVTITCAAAPKGRVVPVVARKFAFVPARIQARKGERLVLQFTAPEVPMGASFPDFGVRADIVPGRVTKLEFVPDKVGTFTFVCDVFCGSGHEDMSGALVVTE